MPPGRGLGESPLPATARTAISSPETGQTPVPLRGANNATSQIFSSPVVVTGSLEVRSDGAGANGTTGPDSGALDSTVFNDGVAETASPPVSKAVALIQLHSLIAVFQEVDDYKPAARRNTPPPVLWINDADYLKNIKAILHELRRLNSFLGASKKPDPAAVAKSTGIVAKSAEKLFNGALSVVAPGLGLVIMGSVFAVLSQFPEGQEVLKYIPLVPKGK